MTLLDIRNQIVSHLCQNDTFSSENFKDIKVDDKFDGEKESLIIAALDNLESINLIRGVSENLWILINPLNSAGQDIHLSMNVCNAIAETVNAFMDANEIKDVKVDPLDIQERDIVELLKIIGEILN